MWPFPVVRGDGAEVALLLVVALEPAVVVDLDEVAGQSAAAGRRGLKREREMSLGGSSPGDTGVELKLYSSVQFDQKSVLCKIIEK